NTSTSSDMSEKTTGSRRTVRFARSASAKPPNTHRTTIPAKIGCAVQAATTAQTTLGTATSTRSPRCQRGGALAASRGSSQPTMVSPRPVATCSAACTVVGALRGPLVDDRRDERRGAPLRYIGSEDRHRGAIEMRVGTNLEPGNGAVDRELQ